MNNMVNQVKPDWKRTHPFCGVLLFTEVKGSVAIWTIEYEFDVNEIEQFANSALHQEGLKYASPTHR